MPDLGPDVKPYVLLEVGRARVTPSVACHLTSFIHDELEALGQFDDYEANRPIAVVAALSCLPLNARPRLSVELSRLPFLPRIG